eukprot:scaffold2353_cov178-Pinguiococcus_pyrenoidosus.AAC.2
MPEMPLLRPVPEDFGWRHGRWWLGARWGADSATGLVDARSFVMSLAACPAHPWGVVRSGWMLLLGKGSM